MIDEYKDIERLLWRDGFFLKNLKKGLLLIIDYDNVQIAACKFSSKEGLKKGMKSFLGELSR